MNSVSAVKKLLILIKEKKINVVFPSWLFDEEKTKLIYPCHPITKEPLYKDNQS